MKEVAGVVLAFVVSVLCIAVARKLYRDTRLIHQLKGPQTVVAGGYMIAVILALTGGFGIAAAIVLASAWVVSVWW